MLKQQKIEADLKKARNRWLIADPYQGTAVEAYFQTLDQVFNCPGEKIASDLISEVVKTRVGDKDFYIKRYFAAGKALRRFVGRSRIRAEWENLINFSQLGIPTPNIVGFGQQVELGQFQRGALITEAIVDSIDLRVLAKTRPEILANRQWRHSVMNQIADDTRLLHSAGYVHGNLNWRNILVTLTGAPKVYFFDCPAGGPRQGKNLQKDMLKDLAFLDKFGRLYLSPADQLRFFKRYRRIEHLSAEDKRDIVKIVRKLDKHRERKQQKILRKQAAKNAEI